MIHQGGECMEEKKRSYYNKNSMMKYLATLKEIRFRVKPEEYARYETFAKQHGYKSMRQFYMDAIEEKMKKG